MTITRHSGDSKNLWIMSKIILGKESYLDNET